MSLTERRHNLRALDLYCGAGGVSMGLHRAGFNVVGIDVRPQPRYPFTFIQADALKPPVNLQDFDFIWASPPCQAHTALKTAWNAKEHPDLIPATRALLLASGKPWCMENVPGAPMLYPVMLCGSMFGLQTDDGSGQLQRHRLFEMSDPILLVPPCSHSARAVTVTSKGGGYNRAAGRPSFPLGKRMEAMGIDWMNDYELSQAIPPAYSEFIARAAIATSALKQSEEIVA